MTLISSRFLSWRNIKFGDNFSVQVQQENWSFLFFLHVPGFENKVILVSECGNSFSLCILWDTLRKKKWRSVQPQLLSLPWFSHESACVSFLRVKLLQSLPWMCHFSSSSLSIHGTIQVCDGLLCLQNQIWLFVCLFVYLRQAGTVWPWLCWHLLYTWSSLRFLTFFFLL